MLRNCPVPQQLESAHAVELPQRLESAHTVELPGTAAAREWEAVWSVSVTDAESTDEGLAPAWQKALAIRRPINPTPRDQAVAQKLLPIFPELTRDLYHWTRLRTIALSTRKPLMLRR
ncbi:hypothetical protein NDU88_007856 [Pleurodeles waltl]|uniref:Uncharacterized protein n=1 Tax=Pleurodeles waltl TaxID=8319 RepID=A0AAV7LVQ1_PLEWA|nr:hypothetical protein NDU88_007856 [Pleurodeles waltl]